MQKITVKEVKGPLGKGEKKFYVIKDDKGAEFNTFDAKIRDVTPGSIINVELVVDGKYVNISKWEMVEAVAPTNGKVETRPGMTPGMWAEKDKADRWSKECNTCFMGIMELATKHETPNHISGKFDEVLDMALDWASTHFKPSTAQVFNTVAHLPEKQEKPEMMSFNNLGDFYTACLKAYKLSKSVVDKEILPSELGTVEGRKNAWLKVIELYGKGPHEKDTINPEDLPF